MKPVKAPTNSPPVMGLAEAALACGVSVSTIRRKRPELEKLGAAQTAKGWHIPITALIELGLMRSVTDAPVTPVEPAVIPALMGVMKPPVDAQRDALVGEVEALRAKLADAERRAAVAEAVAVERDRIIHAQDMALRMLEAGTEDPTISIAESAPAVNEPIANKLDSSVLETVKDASKTVPLWQRLLRRKD